MKLSRIVALFTVIAGLSIASLAQAKDTGAKSVDEAWVKAAKANSIDDLVALYSDDAVGWFPGSPEAKGAKAIRTAYEGWLNSTTIKDAVISDAHYHNAGKLSVGWGKITITTAEKATGKESTMTARFTAVVERQKDGRWLYVVDHASNEPAPPPTPPAAATPAATESK